MEQQAQAERAQRFRALHSSGTFVIANCWDGGSARILTSLGFPALATSSGASAGTLGRLDGNVSLDEAMAQARTICGATSLPVSADLEKGFGDATGRHRQGHRSSRPSTGLVGGSIEDATRPQGRADLRSRLCHRARRGRRGSGTQTAVPFHADRARRELSTRQTRSRRHDQAPAGIRKRRRRCAVRPRPSGPRGGAHGVLLA